MKIYDEVSKKLKQDFDAQKKFIQELLREKASDKERIVELELAVKSSLFGTPMDTYGNLNDNGIYNNCDINTIARVLNTVVPNATRSSFSEELSNKKSK